MNFDEPVTFREAVRNLAVSKVMPTNLSSADLAKINKETMRTSITSARTELEELLENYKRGSANLLQPTMEPGADWNPASFRLFIKDYLKSISYAPSEGEAGTIKDLSSNARINLVINTTVATRNGAGHFIQQNGDEDVVDLWPALELLRFEDREKERDWEGANGLWVNAARRAGDSAAIKVYGETDRMVALKSSGIWEELGDPDYTPGGLGNPYAPFAFNSGMGTEEIDRKETEELGLLDEGEKAEPAKFDFGTLLGM